MYSAYDPALRRRARAPLARRTIAFLVVLAVHALLGLALLLLTPEKRQPPASEPRVFVLLPPPAPAAKPAREKAVAPRKPAAAAKAPPAAPPPVPLPEPPPEPKLFDKQLFDAIDIAKLPNQRALTPPADSAAETAAETADATGSAADSSTSDGPGTGPGGERLYNAEWQREPTNAELSFYLPRGTPQGSWAMVACRTVARFRVEDCRELGESPPGSRLARGIVEAAWQFRVLPPRIGGRPLVGAWVRIRIEFSKAE